MTGLRKLPLYDEGDRLAIYRIQDSRAGLEGGANLGVRGQAAAGWVERRIGAVLDTGPDSFFNNTQFLGGITANLALDTYDQPFFPTRGMKLDVSHFDAQRVSAGAEKYSRTEARFGTAWSHGRWAFLGGLEGGVTPKGTLPLGDTFTLGGPRRLSGFAEGPDAGRRVRVRAPRGAVPPALRVAVVGPHADRRRDGRGGEDGQAVHRDVAHGMAAVLRGLSRGEYVPGAGVPRRSRGEEWEGELLLLHRYAVTPGKPFTTESTEHTENGRVIRE
jgi:hypothetical protein